MSGKTQINNYGVGFLTLLGLLFVGLKLTGFISWSWFWVLSPFIFQGLIVLLILAFIVWALMQS